MTTILTYQNATAGNALIKAIIASSQIVFIVDGEAHLFSDERG